MDLIEAALIEPMAFGEHCTSGLDGQTVVVIGQGPIGLSCSMILHHKKCRVIALDIVDSQLAVSKQIGCDYIINSRKEDPVARIKSIVGAEGLDYVIDTVANNWSINFCMDILNKGATMITVGIPCSEIKLNLLRMICREVSMKTRYLYTDEDFQRAADYVTKREIDVLPMLSKVFPLADIQEAFEYKATVPCLKVVLENAR
jgi:propanol-preferring alcohol dehydrogenase